MNEMIAVSHQNCSHSNDRRTNSAESVATAYKFGQDRVTLSTSGTMESVIFEIAMNHETRYFGVCSHATFMQLVQLAQLYHPRVVPQYQPCGTRTYKSFVTTRAR